MLLCGCETWSLTLREEHKLRVVMKIFDLRGRTIEDREIAYCGVSGFLFRNKYYGNQ